jgi:hypothetical protein
MRGSVGVRLVICLFSFLVNIGINVNRASTHTNQGNNSSYNIFTLKLLGN